MKKLFKSKGFRDLVDNALSGNEDAINEIRKRLKYDVQLCNTLWLKDFINISVCHYLNHLKEEDCWSFKEEI